MKKRWIWFSLLFVVLLVALAPASLLSQTPLKAGQWSGRLWSGTAHDIELANTHLHTAKWQVLWTELLSGWLALQLTLDDPGVKAHTKLFWHAPQWRLEGLTGEMTAAWLSEAFFRGVQMAGDVSFTFQQLAGTERRLTDADGRLQWHNAAIRTPFVQRLLPLGNLRLVAKPAEQHIDFVLTSDAPLRLNLSGRLAPDGGIVLAGTMAATTLPEIDRVVSLITQGYDSGKRKIQFEGRIPGW